MLDILEMHLIVTPLMGHIYICRMLDRLIHKKGKAFVPNKDLQPSAVFY